ncbi:hypothetical protein JGH11_07200 [Dysgonomonas sp. Marseille-P4677]|uniref:hypothetical protein n=1 Tax=Dysgonomonas sp. Marseille-P4677 TaxID=2364790 RepID=UPI001912F33F|nr:hypothetical protein [Dysgonomonas sp. Marseille-P4677]MBK5720655.1 hypothetical protein [Dysgonomonas sp. Marseille-P4677]
MKKKYYSLIAPFFCLVVFILCSSGKKKQELIPEINYEFSGGAGHYNYAPSVIQDEYGIRYAFVCQNLEPFKIVDYVYLFKGIPTKDGYKWQPGTRLVDPSESGWDNIHICDPDVREYKTTYKGETYNWIMTYLGVDRWDCNHNQIGLAVSKSIDGPYIKYENNPIVSFSDTTQWGVGQSTSVVLDDKTIRMFYTNSKDGFSYRDMDLSNLDKINIGEEKNLFPHGRNRYVSYSDKYIFLVSELRDNDSQIPTWVGATSEVKYIPISKGLHTPYDEWITLGRIGPKETGFPRNHNPGFLTDTKGNLMNEDELIVYFTPAVTGENWLWSYDMYSAYFDLKHFLK